MTVDRELRILIVDDMPAMRSIVRGMLLELGYRYIHEAEDGDMAWQIIQQSSTLTPNGKQGPIGLVVADWQMPGMSGVELLRAVRSFAATRDLPFLMVTALGNDQRMSEAMRAGVTDYIVKPFGAEQLNQKMSQIFQD